MTFSRRSLIFAGLSVLITVNGAAWSTISSAANLVSLASVYRFGRVPKPTAPQSAVVEDASGNFYGATYLGGQHGGGAIYEISPSEAGGFSELTIYSFPGNDFGHRPKCSLTLGDGFLCGTTFAGTVFKYNLSAHTLTTVHTFPSLFGEPSEGLCLSHGVIYGTTAGGGLLGGGTVFRMHNNGSTVILHNFGPLDGTSPVTTLIKGADGFLYGATAGASDALGAWSGSILYKISEDGVVFSILHVFDGSQGSTDGYNPWPGPLVDFRGVVYGTTNSGGQYGGGTIFKIAEDGSGYAVIHSFTGLADGSEPYNSLTTPEHGHIYGSTCSGGLHNDGTIFRLDLDTLHFTPLYAFNGLQHGANPTELYMASDGSIWGTTIAALDGSQGQYGTVFRFAP